MGLSMLPCSLVCSLVNVPYLFPWHLLCDVIKCFTHSMGRYRAIVSQDTLQAHAEISDRQKIKKIGLNGKRGSSIQYLN